MPIMKTYQVVLGVFGGLLAFRLVDSICAFVRYRSSMDYVRPPVSVSPSWPFGTETLQSFFDCIDRGGASFDVFQYVFPCVLLCVLVCAVVLIVKKT